jgi:putative DNA primase/helicase
MKRYSAKTVKEVMAIGEPITIPQSLIDKLKPFGPHFLKVAKPIAGDEKSGKRAVEYGWQDKPYNAEELEKWLAAGNNYGTMAGRGIAIIDFDIKSLAEEFEAKVNTLTVQSGRISGEGRHAYIRTDATENGLLFDKDSKQIGNVQVMNKYVVGPGSKHNSGGTYKIIKDVPLEWVSKADLESIFGDGLKWTGAIRKEEEADAEEDKAHVGMDIPMALVVDLDKLKERGDGKYQGTHPIHGSTTGNNFDVNTKKNQWHCFRCDSGGGALKWIAVKHGVIRCDEAHKGALKGSKFIETIRFAKADGLQIIEPDEELNPDVERFFEKDKSGKTHFVPVYVAAELLKENHFLTQTTKGFMFRYNPGNGIYERNGEDFINVEVARKLGKHYDPWREKSVEAYIRARTIKKIPETDVYLLAVKNGILDVRTRELKPFSPEHIIFNSIPVTYDANAKCPLFDKFLPEVVPPEKDRSVLQEHAGYTLLKDNRFEKALMLTGKKQNGKSTFLFVIEALLGEENYCSVPLQILSDPTFRFYLSQLYGKMANICADLPPTKLKEPENFKKVAAGDSITTEVKFVTPLTFRPYAKLLFAANQLPELPKDVEAFIVRWGIVEFPNSFLPGDPRRDPDLRYKLTTPEELSGVLNWALAGLQRLLLNKGFTKSDTLEELEDRWIVEGDTTKAFIDRCVIQVFGEGVEQGKVESAYAKFCEKHKVAPLSPNRFMKAFKEITKAEPELTRIENKPVRVWHGMSLKEEDSE